MNTHPHNYSILKPVIKSSSIIFVTLLTILMMVGCSGDQEPTNLKIAVLPIMDALPMYVAQEQGYFADENLTIEFIPVTSAAERDQIVQAGQADGMINEILSTMFYNSEEPRVTTVRFARVATPKFAHFLILASAESGITTLEDLKGQDIGISEGTIIEYSTDRLLQAEGFSDDEISTVAVPRIPDRLALLNSGELPAANMPDPLADLAIQNGAVIVIDDSSHPEFGHSVITFRNEVIEANPEAIRGFLVALEKAVGDLNNNKEQFNSLLSERQLVPEPLLGTYVIPDFPTASVPLPSQFDDVLEWAQSKGYIERELSYTDVIDDSYLP